MLNTRSRAAAAGALVALTAGTLVGATEMSASAAQDTRITSIASSKPIKAEKFKIRGTVSTKLVRKVKLQRLSRSGWITVKTGKSTAEGRFEFIAATRSKKTYRVRAPKAKIGSRTYKARNTQRRTVRPVSQTARLVVSDTSVRIGIDPLVFRGTFTPARKGRAVDLNIEFNGERDTAPLEQSVYGRVRLDVGVLTEGTTPGTYVAWVTTKAANGAPSKSSKKVTFKVVG